MKRAVAEARCRITPRADVPSDKAEAVIGPPATETAAAVRDRLRLYSANLETSLVVVFVLPRSHCPI